jgi:hypothetical protein
MISLVVIESIDYCAWSREYSEDREGQPEPPHALPVTPFQLPLIHYGDNLTLLAWPQSLKRRIMGRARKTEFSPSSTHRTFWPGELAQNFRGSSSMVLVTVAVAWLA